jgi:hypothetical protein
MNETADFPLPLYFPAALFTTGNMADDSLFFPLREKVKNIVCNLLVNVGTIHCYSPIYKN